MTKKKKTIFKENTLLWIALIGSVATGVYYMGRNQTVNKLIEQGLLTYDTDGKLILTNKGKSKSIIDQSQKMDYSKVTQIVDEEGNISYVEGVPSQDKFNYNAKIITNDGNTENVKINEKGNIVIPVWNSIKKVILPFVK